MFPESNSPDILVLCETNLNDSTDSGNSSSALNKYSPAGHHEQKIKTLVKLNFWWSTIKQQIKLVLKHSLCKNEFNVWVQVLPLHCQVK